jgi:hypothetical protein
MCRSKWFLPGFAGVLGVAMFVALWIGGDPTGGIYAGAVIVAFGVLVLLAGREVRRSARCAETGVTSASE